MSELIEFLKARIAEDEAGASSFHETFCGWSLHEGPGFSEDRCQCGHPERILAECAAKRAIIGMQAVNDEDRHMPGFHYKAQIIESIIRTLAAVYANHPDYRQKWGVVQG